MGSDILTPMNHREIEYNAKRLYFSSRITDLSAKNLTTFPTEIDEVSAF